MGEILTKKKFKSSDGTEFTLVKRSKKFESADLNESEIIKHIEPAWTYDTHPLKRGYLTIPHPKEGKGPKIVKLPDKDLELLRSLTRGFPEMYFLRHERATGGRAVGSRFGKNLLHHRFSRTFNRHSSIRFWTEGSLEPEREFGATEPGE